MITTPVAALELNSFPGGMVPGTELLLYEDPDGQLSFPKRVSSSTVLASTGWPLDTRTWAIDAVRYG